LRATNVLELIPDGLHCVVTPLNCKLRILIFAINEKVKHNKCQGEHGKLKLVVNPVILRLVLEESNYFIFDGFKCLVGWFLN